MAVSSTMAGRDIAHRLHPAGLLDFFAYGSQKIPQQGPFGQATD
jgi:hypothetical protein